MKSHKKPKEPVEATRWFKIGDHPRVQTYLSQDIRGWKICSHCGHKLGAHGWIGGPTAGYRVCPGMWVVADGKGYFPTAIDPGAAK